MIYVYKKVESAGEINIDTMKQEIDNEKLTETKTEVEINPYQKVVLKVDTKMKLRQHRIILVNSKL